MLPEPPAPEAQVRELAREAVPEDKAARNLRRLFVAKGLSLKDYRKKRSDLFIEIAPNPIGRELDQLVY